MSNLPLSCLCLPLTPEVGGVDDFLKLSEKVVIVGPSAFILGFSDWFPSFSLRDSRFPRK